MSWARRGWGVGLLILGMAGAAWLAAAGAAGPVVRLEVRGIIDSVTAQYIDRGLTAAEEQNAELVVLTLDTPGGLDTSMRRITQRLLAARVPVAVYVSPAGARAASAGTFIAFAANLLALAPGTNLGAAHPVDLQGKSAAEKITNDAAAYLESLARLRGRPVAWARQAVVASASVEAQAALRLGVADVVCSNLDELLDRLDGRTVHTAAGDRVLHVRGERLETLPMRWPAKFLHALADPNLSYILFLLGIYGLIYELMSPGAILPGVVGAIAIILALLGFDSLPISLAGILLLALGAVLLGLEWVVVSHGILAAGGLLALVLGSFMMFPSPLPAFRVAWPVLAGMLSVSAAYVALVLWVIFRQRRRRAVSGVESLVGRTGTVKAITPDGVLVHVEGDDWLATPEVSGLAVGDRVEVVAVEGLRLQIKGAGAGRPAAFPENQGGRK